MPRSIAKREGFGADEAWFPWLKEGVEQPDAVHVGPVASSEAAVRNLCDAAVAADASVKTTAGPQLQYMPGYFAT